MSLAPRLGVALLFLPVMACGASERAAEEHKIPLAKDALSKSSDLRVQIRADASATHGKVMRVVDLLKQAGVSRIAFGVTPVPPEPGAVTP